MEIDQGHCPNCGHVVLDWDVMCPGCDQVPWDSPAGRRLMQQRRRRHALLAAAPAVALLGLIGMVVLVGNIHLKKAVGYSQEATDVAEALESARFIESGLLEAEPGSARYEKLAAAGRQWVERHVPKSLETVEDPRASTSHRTAAVMMLGFVFRGSSQLAEFASAYQSRVIDALAELQDEKDPKLRSAASAVLLAIGAEEMLP